MSVFRFLQESTEYATRFDQLNLKKTKKDDNKRGGRGGGRGGGCASGHDTGRGRGTTGRGRGRGRGRGKAVMEEQTDWEQNWDGPWDADDWRAWTWSHPRGSEAWEAEPPAEAEDDEDDDDEPPKAKKGKKPKPAKAKAKAKARAKAKASDKAKRKQEPDDGEVAPAKPAAKAGKAEVKTFARRYRPSRDFFAVRWDCLRAAFQATIQPKIETAPGYHEDWTGFASKCCRL